MRKWLVPAALSLSILMPLAASAQRSVSENTARYYRYENGRLFYRDSNRGDFFRSGRGDLNRNDDRFYRSPRDGRYYRYDEYGRNDRNEFRNDTYRRQLDERADQIAQRAVSLYESGRLSRDHLDRTLEKLDRVQNTVRTDRDISEDRFNADRNWLRQVEETLEDWSRTDGRRR